MDLTTIFCDIDDFVKSLEKQNKQNFIGFQRSNCGPKPRMSLGEIMTIIIYHHHTRFRDFKTFYMYLQTYGTHDFPHLLSYNRFVEWIPYCLIPLTAYLNSRKGKCTGISFIDSTPLRVCKNKRISRNRVFKGIAAKGKSSMGWFFGFKLHVVINEVGDILSFKLTRGNVDDRVPVKELAKHLVGKLYGDKGYIGKKLFEELFSSGLQLVAGIRANMKGRLLPLEDKIMLRKRSLIETVNDQFKNVCDIEHSRHRSPINFLVNVVSALVSYTWLPTKPSITRDMGVLMVA